MLDGAVEGGTEELGPYRIAWNQAWLREVGVFASTLLRITGLAVSPIGCGISQAGRPRPCKA